MASTFPGLNAVRFLRLGTNERIGVRHKVQNVEDLRERIEAVFQKIQQEMLVSTSTVEIRRRCRACIANGGSPKSLALKTAWICDFLQANPQRS
ncbi:hypothetical protein EVAR_37210_1 [Eumeta japonica]|uniref:Uncharacterized protein n=1 Tax=Eumeta variegata TaxID=151549 RepID=A0A4C1Z214_EUMVA|nr:hypothetical protein EVAR_37210_1 [Eumeta japonica]